MNEHVSDKPWLESVTEKGMGWREYFSYFSPELPLAIGTLTPFLALFVASMAPFMVGVVVFAAMLAVLSALCLWASRSRQGLSQFKRGLLFSMGVLLAMTFLWLLYMGWSGYTAENSQDAFYPQPSSYEVRDPKRIV